MSSTRDEDKKEKNSEKGLVPAKNNPLDNYITLGTDFVQRARNNLSLNEDKAVQYTLSKVQPTDEPGKVYYFNCEEFYDVTNNKKQSYSELKAMLQNIADKSIWYHAPDGTDKLLRWFDIVHIHNGQQAGDGEPDDYAGTKYVALTFHPDMYPFILKLVQQQQENGLYLMSYQLKNIAGMKHMYSSRLYRLLKSYQNRRRWVFEYGTGTERDIQVLIATTGTTKQRKKDLDIPKSWSSFTFFERDVLKPAREEINKYTDIVIDYRASKEDLHHIAHRKYSSVAFTISPKSNYEKIQTQQLIEAEHKATQKTAPGQSSMKQMELSDFFADFAKEREDKKKSDDAILEGAKREQAKYPMCAEHFAAYYTAEESDALIDAALNVLPAGKVALQFREVWALDYVDSYNRMVQATPKLTRTTPYRRLMDMVRNDYQGLAGAPSQWDINLDEDGK